MICRACHANDATFGSLCSPCWRDSQSEARTKEQALEQAKRAQAEALRRRRRRWRPQVNTGHGHGTLREASERDTR
jgi:hypothetical protein